MKRPLFWMMMLILMIFFAGQASSQLYFTLSVPDGWEITGLGCNGITAVDKSNPARGIVALNHLHQGFDILPPYTTPEAYVEYYMPQDFSLGETRVSEMKIIKYEADQRLSNAYVSWAGPTSSARSMRCSFQVNGIPAEGSFMVATRELFGYGTTIELLYGIFAPAAEFEKEAPMLLGSIDSIRLIRDYFCVCFDCPPDDCKYKCSNGCCNEPCDENDRCRGPG
ncbi:MAG TPA: hypothetical protein PLY52_11495 [Methanothrix sp.]|uniref:hypothetical protein n=1 Tax=Methanothrix sp. TaxID=90426 RepID=UPI002C4EA34D|nr:hypothetical protein [Methanothrix sp.]MDI9416218.1 hypothetical protein [Euryarchaeota archaeon]HON36916.1 hypothetical protein [Methanothrix sp.]HRU76521.1 hypothetical protein [Methanothrix sp.]